MHGYSGGRTRDYRTVVKTAKDQGWRVGPTRSGHIRFLSPTGGIVITSSTPSDRRTIANLISMLRRNGLRI